MGFPVRLLGRCGLEFRFFTCSVGGLDRLIVDRFLVGGFGIRRAGLSGCTQPDCLDRRMPIRFRNRRLMGHASVHPPRHAFFRPDQSKGLQ